MESDLADVEKDIYLEVLSKHTIYKEYLYSLSDSVSETVEENNKFLDSFRELVNEYL